MTSKLVNMLEAQVTEADSGLAGVGDQRERNHRYYSLQPFGNEKPGCSSYVSPDVFDTVEGKKAYFTETFFSGRQLVRFRASSADDQHQAEQKTAYANQVLEKNRWYDLARDGWHDAFVAKRLVVLAEWLQDSQTFLEPVEMLTGVQVEQLMEQDPTLLSISPADGAVSDIPLANGQLVRAFTGTVEIERDSSYVDLTLVQPERYYRDPNVARVEDGGYAGFNMSMRRGALVDAGYDPDQVSKLKVDYRFRRDEEDTSRKAHDQSWHRRRNNQRDLANQEIDIYKTWTWLDASAYDELTEGQPTRTGREIDPEGIGLYEVHWAHGEVLKWASGELAIREADRIPFFEWTEYKVAHAEHGLADADVVSHTQKTSSVLKRLVVDNQQRRNTSRYEAVTGMLTNPRDLLENPIGGIVWSKRIGSVAPLAAPELSPLTFQAIEMLDQDKEERSGLSRLAQGMNTDAVRYQNADDMIARLTNAANRRVMKSCRDFDKTFFAPLVLYVIELAAQNDQQSYRIEVNGEQVEVSPSQWQMSDQQSSIASAMTPEEGLKRAQSLLMMDAQLNQRKQADPVWGILYGVKEQYALIDDVFDALGVVDSSRYMARLTDPRTLQQLQAMQQQQQQSQQQAQMAQMFQQQLIQSADQREWRRVQLDAIDKAADNTREDDKFEHDKVIDFAELEIERRQQRGAKVG